MLWSTRSRSTRGRSVRVRQSGSVFDVVAANAFCFGDIGEAHLMSALTGGGSRVRKRRKDVLGGAG